MYPFRRIPSGHSPIVLWLPSPPWLLEFHRASALVTTHLEEWSDELADNRDTRGYVQVVRTPDGLFLDEQHQRLGQNAIVLHGLSGGL